MMQGHGAKMLAPGKAGHERFPARDPCPKDAEAARGVQTSNTQNQNTGERLRKEKRYVQQETVLEIDELFSSRGISLQQRCRRVI
jgi:hypothetical protein